MDEFLPAPRRKLEFTASFNSCVTRGISLYLHKNSHQLITIRVQLATTTTCNQFLTLKEKQSNHWENADFFLLIAIFFHGV